MCSDTVIIKFMIQFMQHIILVQQICCIIVTVLHKSCESIIWCSFLHLTNHCAIAYYTTIFPVHYCAHTALTLVVQPIMHVKTINRCDVSSRYCSILRSPTVQWRWSPRNILSTRVLIYTREYSSWEWGAGPFKAAWHSCCDASSLR